MKLAVLIFGEYREHELAVKTWDFLNHFECDIYYSTWNKSIQHDDKLGIRIEEIITEEKIKSIFPNAVTSILDYDEYLGKFVNNAGRLYFHWEILLGLLKNSGKEYTHVMLIRPELYIRNFGEDYSTWEGKIDPNALVSNEPIRLIHVNTYFCPDWFFLGNYNTVVSFLENLPKGMYFHEDLAAYIISLGYFCQTFDMAYKLMRGCCRNLEEINWVTVSDCQEQWFKK
jgi:hypothetical protein